jgi:hypothetical protein
LLGSRGANAWKRRQPLGVLPLDGVGDFAHRANEGLHCFADANFVNRAEKVEEIQLDFVHETDEPWDHAVRDGVSFEEMACVERHLLPVLMLQEATNELGDQHRVFERSDLEPNLVVLHAIDDTGDFGNHDRFRVGCV